MSLSCVIDTNTNAGLNSAINQGVLLNTHLHLISPFEITNRRTIILFSVTTEEELFLPLNNLFILDYDLMAFLDNKMQKIDAEFEIAQLGRKTDKHLNEIIALGKKTFEKFPFATANKIAKEVREFIKEKYNIPDHSIIKSNRILEYYKAHNIGAEGKARNTKKPIQVITD